MQVGGWGFKERLIGGEEYLVSEFAQSAREFLGIASDAAGRNAERSGVEYDAKRARRRF